MIFTRHPLGEFQTSTSGRADRGLLDLNGLEESARYFGAEGPVAAAQMNREIADAVSFPNAHGARKLGRRFLERPGLVFQRRKGRDRFGVVVSAHVARSAERTELLGEKLVKRL